MLQIALISITPTFGEELPNSTAGKYPDYASMYLGRDKCETFNRKMFTLNKALNKFVLRPVDVVWASIMPKYGMERIKGVYNNIEYPKRLVSTLVQKDFKASGTETLRFLTNSTIGLGGMFDPAKRFFKLEPVQENMEQALCKCKCNQGPYMVVPGIPATTPRGLCGKALDAALNPTCYIGTPILALIKLGFTINETSYMQPLADMIQSDYADPYEIVKKLYGVENYIRAQNFDRKDIKAINEEIEDKEAPIELVNEEDATNIDAEKVVSTSPKIDTELDDKTLALAEHLMGRATERHYLTKKIEKPKADIVLEGFNPQTPAIDAMRTVLFNLPGIDNSIWSEISIWNRSFAHRIKTSSINITPDKDDYSYRYIMQKDKSAPLAIIYPSIGEGIKSHHSVVFAKLFYDKGYSVLMLGSNFQWEFVKSMPDGYYPGVPSNDAIYLQDTTKKILTKLENKYNCKFDKKVLIGTSFGAISTLFVGAREYKNNELNISKYISINPPIELFYAMREVDKSNESWAKNPNNLKERVALTSAKVLQLLKEKDNPDFKIDTLPFNDYEAKLITGFVMHQKLSDLIFTIENSPKNKKSDIYETINNMNFEDYLTKYVIKDKLLAYDELNYDTSLYSLSDFLQNSDNYRIYHTLDDYLVNSQQLAMLKKYAGKKAIYLNNGSHLGFMYRTEFIDALIKDIQDLTIDSKIVELMSKICMVN